MDENDRALISLLDELIDTGGMTDADNWLAARLVQVRSTLSEGQRADAVRIIERYC